MIFWRRDDTATDETTATDTDRRQETDAVRQAKQLKRELAEIVARANADGGRLPPGAVPAVRGIDDVLRPLLDYIEVQSASDEAMRSLTAIIHEYVPQALNDFTVLPAHYLYRRGVTGTTPADELVRQLEVLDEAAGDLQDLVYTGQAAKLAIQARFLDAKFRRSDLDS